MVVAFTIEDYFLKKQKQDGIGNIFQQIFGDGMCSVFLLCLFPGHCLHESVQFSLRMHLNKHNFKSIVSACMLFWVSDNARFKTSQADVLQ